MNGMPCLYNESVVGNFDPREKTGRRMIASPFLFIPIDQAKLEESALQQAQCPAASFCCFSRCSRKIALRDSRILLPSMASTLTSTWSPSF